MNVNSQEIRVHHDDLELIQRKDTGGISMIQETIVKLIQYGLVTGLVEKEDAIYTTNRVLELLQLDTLEESAEAEILSGTPDEDIVAQLEQILHMKKEFWRKIR